MTTRISNTSKAIAKRLAPKFVKSKEQAKSRKKPAKIAAKKSTVVGFYAVLKKFVADNADKFEESDTTGECFGKWLDPKTLGGKTAIAILPGVMYTLAKNYMPGSHIRQLTDALLANGLLVPGDTGLQRTARFSVGINNEAVNMRVYCVVMSRPITSKPVTTPTLVLNDATHTSRILKWWQNTAIEKRPEFLTWDVIADVERLSIQHRTADVQRGVKAALAALGFEGVLVEQNGLIYRGFKPSEKLKTMPFTGKVFVDPGPLPPPGYDEAPGMGHARV